MLETTPNTTAMAFAMVARTTAIDTLVLHALEKGVDTVINLGAGLDTRPYRLNLPRSLRWIEVDFPSTVDYKNDMLILDEPRCQVERIASDLSDSSKRKILFGKLGRQTNRALVITEGVVAYLSNKQAAELSADMHAQSSFSFWIMDYAQGKLRRNKYQKKLDEKLVEAPLQFDVEKPIEFFGEQGWSVEENIYILDEADRIGRKLPLRFPMTLAMMLFPKKIRELGNKTYGYVMFKR